MATFFRRSRSGFTLTELIVVIAIIGILSGIVFANLHRAREHGNNARIAADIAQLQLALGMLHARGQNPPFPSTGGTGAGNFRCLGATNCLWNMAGVPALSSANPSANSLLQSVINPIPGSQLLGGNNRFRGYQYASDGNGFRLRWFYFGENRPCDPGGAQIASGSGITLCWFSRPWTPPPPPPWRSR